MSLTYERPKIDPIELTEVYKTMSGLVYLDLDKQYKEGKISGATYASTYAELMKAIITGSLQSITSLLTKETDHDRCIKEEQCASSQAKTTRDDSLSVEQIDASTAKTTRDDSLASKEIEAKTEQIIASESKTTRDNSLAEKEIEAKTEQITASTAKTTNETCIATATCAKTGAEQNLIIAKQTAEDIKNGDIVKHDSLYGKNIMVADAQEKLYIRQKCGFDDNANQKFLDSVTGPYSILFQDLALDFDALPNIFKAQGSNDPDSTDENAEDGFNKAVERITDNLNSMCSVVNAPSDEANAGAVPPVVPDVPAET